LDITENALKMTVYRLRKRYGELVRAEIALVVDSPAEIEQEIEKLATLLRGKTLDGPRHQAIDIQRLSTGRRVAAKNRVREALDVCRQRFGAVSRSTIIVVDIERALACEIGLQSLRQCFVGLEAVGVERVPA